MPLAQPPCPKPMHASKGTAPREEERLGANDAGHSDKPTPFTLKPTPCLGDGGNTPQRPEPPPDVVSPATLKAAGTGGGGKRVRSARTVSIAAALTALSLLTCLTLSNATVDRGGGAGKSLAVMTDSIRTVPTISWPPPPLWEWAQRGPYPGGLSGECPTVSHQDAPGPRSFISAEELAHSTADVRLSDEHGPRNFTVPGGGSPVPADRSPHRRAYPPMRDLSPYQHAGRLTVRYGVLTAPMMVYSRLLPLLNTSLLHVDAVDVFIRRTPFSYAVAALITAEVRRWHPKPSAVRVVELDGPTNAQLADRRQRQENAWMNMEVARFWAGEAAAKLRGDSDAHQQSGLSLPIPPLSPAANLEWYGIVDDDAYVFTSNVRMALAKETERLLNRFERVTADPTTTAAAGDVNAAGGGRLVFVPPSTAAVHLVMRQRGDQLHLEAKAIANLTWLEEEGERAVKGAPPHGPGPAAVGISVFGALDSAEDAPARGVNGNNGGSGRWLTLSEAADSDALGNYVDRDAAERVRKGSARILPPIIAGLPVNDLVSSMYYAHGGPGQFFNLRAILALLPLVTPSPPLPPVALPVGTTLAVAALADASQRPQVTAPSACDAAGVSGTAEGTLPSFFVPSRERAVGKLPFDHPFGATTSEGSYCKRTFAGGGGDVRLSHCLLAGGRWATKFSAEVAAEAGPSSSPPQPKPKRKGRRRKASPKVSLVPNAELVSLFSSFWDVPMRAVAEARFNTLSPFPTSFHRIRDRRLMYRLFAIEALRREAFADLSPTNAVGASMRAQLPLPLVTWGDVETNFYEGSGHYGRSAFYPREYDNFTRIRFRRHPAALAKLRERLRLPADADPWLA